MLIRRCYFTFCIKISAHRFRLRKTVLQFRFIIRSFYQH